MATVPSAGPSAGKGSLPSATQASAFRGRYYRRTKGSTPGAARSSAFGQLASVSPAHVKASSQRESTVQSPAAPDEVTVTPLTAKYSDNGRANTSAQLRNYFFDYIRRNPAGTIRHLLELKSEDVFRKLVPINSGPYKKVQALYWKYK